ncbi:MAG: hydrogenase maturation nickel metallochaperone HypA [Bacteroidetes bacterium]|nr:hydrogenase maturation nickel metallochaperone HypA [Bacteroidota bacterium]
MHELSIAQSILDIVRENLSANGGGRLKSVRVKIGELAGVVPDSLDFCFGAITKGTEMEEARLEIERTGIVARCDECGRDFPIEGLVFRCPVCESAGIKVISGNELRVVEIEVEDGEQT